MIDRDDDYDDDVESYELSQYDMQCHNAGISLCTIQQSPKVVKTKVRNIKGRLAKLSTYH